MIYEQSILDRIPLPDDVESIESNPLGVFDELMPPLISFKTKLRDSDGCTVYLSFPVDAKAMESPNIVRRRLEKRMKELRKKYHV